MNTTRLPYAGMTDEEIEALVGKVSQRVIDNFYQEIGRSIFNKFLWVIGIVTVSLLIGLAASGKLKILQ